MKTQKLIGKILDLEHLPDGWTASSKDGGCEVFGVVDTRRCLDRDEMLDIGVLSFDSGRGMSVMARVFVTTSDKGKILTIHHDGYATAGADMGRPIECELIDEDVEVVHTTLSESLKSRSKASNTEKRAPARSQKSTGYQFVLKGSDYVVTKDGVPMTTPVGNVLATSSKALAERLVDHLETLGEGFSDPTTLLTFHYSYLDFYNTIPRPEIERSIILGLDEDKDWTFTRRPIGTAKDAEWVRLFGTHADNAEPGKKWLSTLTLHQLCAVCVIGRAIESVNIPRLLATRVDVRDMSAFAKEVDARYPYVGVDDLMRFFNNFLFYFRSGS